MVLFKLFLKGPTLKRFLDLFMLLLCLYGLTYLFKTIILYQNDFDFRQRETQLKLTQQWGMYPLTPLLSLETVQSPGLVGRLVLSAAPATVGFILQLIPSALQDDCESIKIVFPFSPEKSHGQKNLAGHSPKGCKESDKTERLSKHTVKRERTFTSMKYRPFLLIWSGVQGAHALFCTTVARRLPWAGWLKPALPSCHHQGTWDCHALGLLG